VPAEDLKYNFVFYVSSMNDKCLRRETDEIEADENVIKDVIQAIAELK
jgi:hypothetical protein